MARASDSPLPRRAPFAEGGPGGAARIDRAYHVLLETARQLNSSLEPAAIFARLKDNVCAALPCDGLIVSSFDRASSEIRCSYAWVGGNVLDASTLPPLTFKPEGGGMQSQVLRTGQPMLFSDVAERVRDPRGTYYEVDRAGGVRDLKSGGPPLSRSAIMVPLRLEGEVVGVVQVMADRDGVYVAEDLELLEGVSLLLAIALENARLYRRAQADLEERRHAERVLRDAEERYRALVTQSTEGIYRLEFVPPIDVALPVDEQVRLAYERGRIDECNDAFARMYGFERAEDVLGFGLDPLLPVSDPAAVAHVRGVILSEYHVVDVESVETDRHGRPVWISNTIHGVVEDGRLLRIWGTQKDVSDRRRNEEALREADRHKNEFLATLGHELRNPLHPIRNAVEILRRKPADDADTRRSHDLIERQVVHLARLIDDLLDVSRISQGKLELRPAAVALQDVLAAAIESMSATVAPARQRLTVEQPGEPLIVEGDAVRLTQVISNLLDNASKYSPQDARIQVRLERDGTGALLRIRDQGMGIPREHLTRVFDLFYQAGGGSSPGGGLGIGLTLVQRLVEMHGGTIAATSEGAGQGSEFVVRLPLATARPGPAATTAAPPPLRPMRMLVADDNRDSADSMALLLRLDGNEVHVAYDGEEALRVAARERPEVLLLDLGMPRLNGLEVAERLRREPWGRDLVLIAATGWGLEEDRRRTLEKGFDAHLVKPVDHAALLALVADLIQRRTPA